MFYSTLFSNYINNLIDYDTVKKQFIRYVDVMYSFSDLCIDTLTFMSDIISPNFHLKCDCWLNNDIHIYICNHMNIWWDEKEPNRKNTQSWNWMGKWTWFHLSSTCIHQYFIGSALIPLSNINSLFILNLFKTSDEI